MYIGQITTTHDGNPVEIESISKDGLTATVYQLDDQGNRFDRFRAEGFLMGRITIKEVKQLDL